MQTKVRSGFVGRSPATLEARILIKLSLMAIEKTLERALHDASQGRL